MASSVTRVSSGHVFRFRIPVPGWIALGYGRAMTARPEFLRHMLLGKSRMPTIDRDGVKIHYEVHGSGPPLLLTHGYSSTSGMWQGQIAALSKHHKLVLWDMRGHGQSDYPEDTSAYSEALTVADMAALLDAVGAEQGDRRRALARRLHVAGVLPRPSGPRPRAPDHRHRPRLQEGRGPRGLEQARARHRRPLRARGAGGSEIGQPGTLQRHPPRRVGTGARRARHADPARCPRDRVPARYQGAVADRGRRRRHAVPRRLRLHGRQDSRRAEGGDPGRRPRRQHRPAAGLHRRRAAVPRRPRCQGNGRTATKAAS